MPLNSESLVTVTISFIDKFDIKQSFPFGFFRKEHKKAFALKPFGILNFAVTFRCRKRGKEDADIKSEAGGGRREEKGEQHGVSSDAGRREPNLFKRFVLLACLTPHFLTHSHQP